MLRSAPTLPDEEYQIGTRGLLYAEPESHIVIIMRPPTGVTLPQNVLPTVIAVKVRRQMGLFS